MPAQARSLGLQGPVIFMFRDVFKFVVVFGLEVMDSGAGADVTRTMR